MQQLLHRRLRSLPNAAREIRRHGILYSIHTMRRSPDLCFSFPAILATKTRKRFVRRLFYRWSEIYLHFRVEAHFKRGCCGLRRTRRWIIGKKREPRNEVETRCTFQSIRGKLITNRRLEIPVPIGCCRLPRPPDSLGKASIVSANCAGKS